MNPIEIYMHNHSFDPNEIEIESGTEVIFKNDDFDVHTVTADDGSFDSGEIHPGTDYHYTFYSPGECEIHNELHPEMKMHIKVV